MKNLISPEIKTYNKDKRKEILKLYQSYLSLEEKGWIVENIYGQNLELRDKKYSLPILSFRTKKMGKALWIISGIHGEEPAGPNALAISIESINKLSKKFPIVFLPLCNPIGYIKNWRYPNRKKQPRKGALRSVGSSEHYLLNSKETKPRAKKPLCKDAAALTSYILKISKKYQPVLVVDFHEDDSSKKLYIYSSGKLGSDDKIAKEVVSILKKRGFEFHDNGKTKEGVKIEKGIVGGVKDSSIDELLGSERVIINKNVVDGPRAKSVIVVETTSKNIPIKKRIKAHTEIIKNLPRFFTMAKKI